ncbi:MAG: exodeoxyribonuclease VII small subunit [Actinomycetota bacterium]|jgi:exonuclease VII small subunit|nr:exodeoxyribonuclease VII small subunit [Actinomycetota bacterium]
MSSDTTGETGEDRHGPDGGSPSPDVPVTSLSYSEASRELDGIVAFFEGRDVDVDRLVAKLERATALVDELDRRIRATGAQVEELVPRLAAAGRPDAPAGGAEANAEL